MTTATVGLRCWGEDTYHHGQLMKLRLARGPVLVPLAVLLSSGVAKAWTSEHPSEAIPASITKVLALDGGGSLVLGGNYKCVQGHDCKLSDAPVRIGPDGEVSVFSHPDAGALRDAAVRGEELWILGSKAVLYRNGQEEWKSIPLPAGVSCGEGKYSPTALLDASDVRDSNITGTDRAQGAVTCTDSGHDPRVPHATTILIMHADLGVQAQYEFKNVAMGLLVPDGHGGFWTYVDSREASYERILGAAWYSRAKWTLWPTGSPVPAGFEVRKNEATLNPSNFAAEDGKGGYWLIAANGQRTHIQLGVASAIQAPPYDRPGPAAFDRNTGDLLLFANDWRYLRDRDFGELVRIGADGHIRDQDMLPMSSAARKLESGSYMNIESMSVGRDETWLSSSTFVIRRHKRTWTFYWSPAAVADMAKDSYAGKWALGTLAFATPGVFGGTSINGERYWATTVQTLSGSLLGTIPLLLSPGEMQMFVAHGPSGCVIGDYFSCLVYGGEAAVASVLTGLGTFAAGESMRGSRRTGAAFGGAMAGAFAGTLSAAVLSIVVSEILPDGITVGMDLGLMGSGATIGYQWAGGGPRR
jgi:hypothetical protein